MKGKGPKGYTKKKEKREKTKRKKKEKKKRRRRRRRKKKIKSCRVAWDGNVTLGTKGQAQRGFWWGCLAEGEGFEEVGSDGRVIRGAFKL